MYFQNHFQNEIVVLFQTIKVESKVFCQIKIGYRTAVICLFLIMLFRNGAYGQMNFISEEDQGSAVESCELLFFSVVNSTLNQRIQWTTSSEYSTNFFVIEKSSNGIDFEMIGAEQAVGNSFKRITYTFQDTTENNDINYFRIKYVNHYGVYTVVDELKVDNTYFMKTKKIQKIVDYKGDEVTEFYRGLVTIDYIDGTREVRIN